MVSLTLSCDPDLPRTTVHHRLRLDCPHLHSTALATHLPFGGASTYSVQSPPAAQDPQQQKNAVACLASRLYIGAQAVLGAVLVDVIETRMFGDCSTEAWQHL